MNLIQELTNKGLAKPPHFVPDNVMYLTVMGSVAYGVSDGASDFDVYGFVIPPKDVVFPHLAGEILGFGRQKKRFEQYQQHHIYDKDALGGKGRNYDICVYNIVKYFSLVMENNPNMIDSLFTPRRCVLTSTVVWEMIREKREMFLHKGCFHKFKGYAYSQLHRMEPKFEEVYNEETDEWEYRQIFPQGNRREMVEKYGYDLKFAYHVVRLLLECEQILETGDLDLERDREILKAIRRGEWELQEVKDWFYLREKYLDELYHTSKLPHSPNQEAIKELLLNCLEHHYGDLSSAVVVPGRYENALRQVQEIVNGALG